MSSGPDGDMLTLCEDSTVKIIPVALAKDGMQLKPGLLYDTRQGKLIGNTLNLDYNYIKQGEPDNFGYDKEWNTRNQCLPWPFGTQQNW